MEDRIDLEAVIKNVEASHVSYVDLRFTDLLGEQLHFQIPKSRLTTELFQSGLKFDGSSVTGWKGIQESDMIMMPDPGSLRLSCNCASFVCNIIDPLTGKFYNKDPRQIALSAERYLRDYLVCEDAKFFFGPELEFFVFNEVEYLTSPNKSCFKLTSREASWNKSGPKTATKGGYFSDSLAEFRSCLMKQLENAGLEVELAHHEVGGAGQCEVGVRFNSLAKKADEVMLFKKIVKFAADIYGLHPTFMPKPIWGDNGNGMHCHQSIFANNENQFYHQTGKYKLSQFAWNYIGGILHHARALAAFTNPTTNSYKRLVPGFEAPIHLVFGGSNRSAAIRIPADGGEKSTRIEVRFPDPMANPYLAGAAMLMAGLDGVSNKIDPGEPVEQNLYDAKSLPQGLTMPSFLEEALYELEADYEFLLKGGVFKPELIETWLKLKEEEARDVSTYPHPREFELYF